MPQLSAFTGCGFLRMSADPSYAEAAYDSLIQGELDAFNNDPGTPRDATNYARALGIADARCNLEYAGNQVNAVDCYTMLTDQERRYGLTPGPYDTIISRQSALAAAMTYAQGGRRSNVVAVLRGILGTDFLAYRVLASNETTTSPATPGTSGITHCIAVATPPKYLKLVDPVVITGAPSTVLYSNLDTTAGDTLLAVGDVVVVGAGHNRQHEKVTVTASTGSLTTKTFTTTFANAHDIGAVVTTMDYPYWWSTQRQVLIVVKSASAVSATARAKVDKAMRTLARSVDNWSIVQPTSPGALTIGPFQVNTSPLGVATVASLAFTLDP